MIRQAFIPQSNQIHLFNKHSVLFFDQGQGTFQIDFRNYHFDQRRAIFLSPGQYFQLISGNFRISLYEFPGDDISQTANSRYLFKHLVSLGYIDLTQPGQFHLKSLQHIDLSNHKPEILHNAVEEWIHQNPFSATESEVSLLFDIKDEVDERYREPLTLQDISGKLHEKPYRITDLTRKKLQTTIKKLAHQRLLLEAQRKVAFSDWSTKEIAYELGFSDPPYFNRFFKASTHLTPGEFRGNFENQQEHTLIRDLEGLIDVSFRDHHKTDYYADQLSLTAKSLSRKVKDQSGSSVHQMIQDRILQESKSMLVSGSSVREIAFDLGFSEPHHFTRFFKQKTGMPPSDFREEQLLS